MKKIIIGFLLSLSTLIALDDLGIQGTVYPVLEESYMIEIEENSKKIDWKDQISTFKKNVREAFKAKGDLPKCVATSERFFIKMNTLKYPITGASGEVLFPAGYKYNVLELMAKHGLVDPKGMLFVDIDDGLHEEYAKILKDSSTPYAVDGDIEKAAERGFQIEKGDSLIKDLDIKCTPSLYIQEKDRYRIMEIDNNELKAIIEALKLKVNGSF